MRYLRETRDRLLEKRKRRAEREGISFDQRADPTGAVGVGETSGSHDHTQTA